MTKIEAGDSIVAPECSRIGDPEMFGGQQSESADGRSRLGPQPSQLAEKDTCGNPTDTPETHQPLHEVVWTRGLSVEPAQVAAVLLQQLAGGVFHLAAGYPVVARVAAPPPDPDQLPK